MSSTRRSSSRKDAPTSANGGEQKKAKTAERKGTDSQGNEYKDVEDLWRQQFVDSAEVSTGSAEVNNKKGAWYQKGADYWLSQAASVDGVLGGFGHISPVDITGSKQFLSHLPGVSYDRAIDCGAGIGRISKGLLCPLFKSVDLVEQSPVYVAKAREYCADCKTMSSYFTQGLQDFAFEPSSYDVIWIQWVIGHLPDADFLPFMSRCVAGLKSNGYIVLKENNAKKGFVMDLDDQSVTRTDAQYRALFEAANLELVACELQKNFPASLFPVRMYALQPKKTTSAATASASSSASSMETSEN